MFIVFRGWKQLISLVAIMAVFTTKAYAGLLLGWSGGFLSEVNGDVWFIGNNGAPELANIKPQGRLGGIYGFSGGGRIIIYPNNATFNVLISHNGLSWENKNFRIINADNSVTLNFHPVYYNGYFYSLLSNRYLRSINGYDWYVYKLPKLPLPSGLSYSYLGKKYIGVCGGDIILADQAEKLTPSGNFMETVIYSGKNINSMSVYKTLPGDFKISHGDHNKISCLGNNIVAIKRENIIESLHTVIIYNLRTGLERKIKVNQESLLADFFVSGTTQLGAIGPFGPDSNYILAFYKGKTMMEKLPFINTNNMANIENIVTNGKGLFLATVSYGTFGGRGGMFISDKLRDWRAVK